MRRSTTRTRRFSPALALLLVLALALAACGKKGPPEPSEGETATYPRSYPTR